ncbi:MAG: hypothetical protein HQL67_07535 [Magnetococcales bacterium]|nr:hypothetical protein [Magnetococcales bacterium]
MSGNDNQSPARSEKQYSISDPDLLKNMQLSRDILAPNSDTILVSQSSLITPKLIEHLRQRHIEKIFAIAIEEKSIKASIEHMEQAFSVIEGILNCDDAQVEVIAENFNHKKHLQDLETLVRSNLNQIDDLFKADSTEKLVSLTQHHNNTARHSLIAAFQLMAVGRELGWSDAKIVKGAVALLNHDLGKTKVNLETLNWPGRLNNQQWKEIQFHPLFGGRMLFLLGQEPDLIMLSALLHHEWYALVEGKGYGGLTLFARFVERAMKFDCKEVVSQLDEDDLDIIQITCLADMVSALEESRAYKRGLDCFKVLIIMNTDAKMGHFRPDHFAAWHRVYMRQNPELLPVGRRMALPREKENRIFTKEEPKNIRPTELLTYYEMDKMGFLALLGNVGMDMERIRRRGGLSLMVLNQINKDKGLGLDLSEAAIKKNRINPVKKVLIREKQVIELDAWREWLTYDELERSGLLGRAKTHHFDMDLIRAEGGICPQRLEKRGVEISKIKLSRLGLRTLKKLPVLLPGSEDRLTEADLNKIGITNRQLDQAGCLARVKKVKSGVPLAWLVKRGIPITPALLAKNGVDPVRKIFYDIQVVKEISMTKAQFMILREGDDPNELESLNEKKKLEPIQDLLLNTIGLVVMDFSDLLALPDLSHVKMGAHWGRG